MLLEEALALGAELELGVQVDSIDSSGTHVTLADGSTRAADVVIGADGKTSCHSQSTYSFRELGSLRTTIFRPMVVHPRKLSEQGLAAIRDWRPCLPRYIHSGAAEVLEHPLGRGPVCTKISRTLDGPSKALRLLPIEIWYRIQSCTLTTGRSSPECTSRRRRYI